MTKIMSFSGQAPTEISGASLDDAAAVLRIMEAQLAILKALTTNVLLVPEGTNLRLERDDL